MNGNKLKMIIKLQIVAKNVKKKVIFSVTKILKYKAKIIYILLQI